MQETSGRPSRAAKQPLPYSPKDRIGHSVFGLGTIVEIDERRTTIKFDEGGTRKFVTSMMKLVPSDTPAPQEQPRAKKKAVRRKTA